MTRIINAGNRVINTYLLELEDGWMLIDTGYPDGYSAFQRRIEKRGITLDNIRWIFLTYAHDDHAGFQNELLGQCNALVLLHERAMEGLRRGQNNFNGGCTSRLALAACHVMAMLGKGGHRFPPLASEYESCFAFCREGDPLACRYTRQDYRNARPYTLLHLPAAGRGDTAVRRRGDERLPQPPPHHYLGRKFRLVHLIVE